MEETKEQFSTGGAKILEVDDIVISKGITKEAIISFQINDIRLALNNIVSPQEDINRIKVMLKTLEILEGNLAPEIKDNLEQLNQEYYAAKEEAAREQDPDKELQAEMNYIVKKFSELVNATIKRGDYSEIDAIWDMSKEKEAKKEIKKIKKEKKHDNKKR